MKQENKNLLVIALIAVVNALGYGIIIPILYSYSRKYGLSVFQNGLLFTTYSICQFFATPLIGRLSDKYGRKPMLLLSLAGTAVSFFMAAFAPNAIFLFLARAIDGITAGNIPVASAVISDTTPPKDRAKGFGIIGAAFGFGFIFGPAISAFTLQFGTNIPFIIAGCVTVIAVILTQLLLPETNLNKKDVKKGKIIDIPLLARAAFDKNIGLVLIISLIYAAAFSLFTTTFQPFAVTVFGFNAQQISVTFTLFGVIGLVTQGYVMPKLTKKFGENRAFVFAFLFASIAFFGMYTIRSVVLFIAVSLLYGLANSFANPLIQTLLSKETDEHAQGSILGLNASYISIGTIFGPILGGALATNNVSFPFLAGGFITAVCFSLSLRHIHRVRHKLVAWE
jgi:MFS family permease